MKDCLKRYLWQLCINKLLDSLETRKLDERILVTGATGFVGTRLVRRLHEEGYHVKGLVRPTSNVSRIANLDIEIVRGDAHDIKSLDVATDNVDVIFNTIGGGCVSTKSRKGRDELRDLNVLSLKNLLEVIRGKPVSKIIHFSSISAMGVQGDVELDERSVCKPVTPHEVAKRESEEVALSHFKDFGTPVTILRPSQIYGPGDTRSEILKMAKLVKRHFFPLIDGGGYYMPWVYVDDVVDCAVSAMLSGNPGEIYIVSDKLSFTLRNIVQEIEKTLSTRNSGIYLSKRMALLVARTSEFASRILGVEPFFTTYRVNSVTSNRFVSIEKAAAQLAYQPKTSLESGMKQTMEWYGREGFL